MSTTRNVVLALTAIQLAGCVTVKPVFGPDGQPASAISCSDSSLDWSDCFAKAGEICGTRGYKIWNQSASPNGILIGDHDSVYGGASEDRTLLIACK
jgi:hypothetical protein